jgi:hypothetical protein
MRSTTVTGLKVLPATLTVRPGVAAAVLSARMIALLAAEETVTPACARLSEKDTVALAVAGGGGRAGGAGGLGGEGGFGGEGGSDCNRLLRGAGASAPPALASSCTKTSSIGSRHGAPGAAARVRERILRS